MRTATQIRQEFIDFFVKKHGHTFVPSSPVVPQDDPTLLFTNAGMNQFKPYFLGTEKPPYKRVANSQKCIRAGGKHNDLDDVGKDTYHHTFFEMLGNWSFGDYFKKEAIAWAWELLTQVWSMDKSRLHVTVFEGDKDQGLARDDEAAEYWRTQTDINPSHIHLGNKKDNFWEMGDTGPCGPCTEIHYDRTPDKSGIKLVNKGTPDVIEIWNLVFIQFNSSYNDPTGLLALKIWDSTPESRRNEFPYRSRDEIVAKFRTLTPLPAKHVDTGMGFERVTAVLQGKTSNYDTDVFTPIFDAIQKLTGAPKYTGKLDDFKDTAYRVIADHIRALTFALTDGALPGNKERGYVLRSILRRAERYGRQYLGATKPFLHQLVPTVVEVMSGAFPELKNHPDRVANVIFGEEESFIRTLDRGIKLFEDVAARTRKAGRNVISGQDTFDLHTTYGFYPAITEQMAAEIGMTVDMEEYQRIYKIFVETTGGDRPQIDVSAVSGELPKTDDSPKYGQLQITANVIGWVQNNAVVRSGTLHPGDKAGLLLDRTNFYAEQGGQIGDEGFIVTPTGRFEVTDTKKLGDAILHVGFVEEGRIESGQAATVTVGGKRPHTMRNHTTTHLLNWALRQVLGDHIEQRGSLVDAEKTRFDFAHDKALSSEEVAEVERLVNEQIYADLPVTARIMPLAQAKQIPGVRAVFGEKYPDPVRVLLIGVDDPAKATVANSVEFCGGTHLMHTGQAGFFKIVSQEPVSKGVRRVTGVTGRGAVAAVQQMASVLDDLTARFNCKPEDVVQRVEALQDEMKKLQTQLKKGVAGDLNTAADKLIAAAANVNGAKVIVGELPPAPVEQMRAQLDRIRQIAKSAVVCVGWVDEGKVGLLTAVTDDLTKKIEAGKLVGEAAKVVGGKGGGRKDMAQAGGNEPAKLAEALALAKKLACEKLA